VACSQPAKQYKSPPGYDFNMPQKFVMGENLQEISGLVFKEGRADTAYAIQDEQGKLFYFTIANPGKSYSSKFAKSGDYEDLAILGDRMFILKSNGSIYTFPLKNVGQQEQDKDSVVEFKKILPEGEYESLYADNAAGRLYTICKKCAADKKAHAVTGFIFAYRNDSLMQEGTFSVDVKAAEKLSDEKKLDFRPSAMAKNTATNEWYIISSIDKNLVVTDANFVPKAVYGLNSNTFRQPEGIAFDRQHNLYISNEGDETGNGNVLKFMLKK
jgi:hypothetical protein